MQFGGDLGVIIAILFLIGIILGNSGVASSTKDETPMDADNSKGVINTVETMGNKINN